MSTILSQSDLITGGVGVLSGFISRAQQNRHELNKLNLEVIHDKFVKNIEDQKAARKFQNPFMFVGRLLIILLLAGTLMVGLLLAGIYQWNVNIETVHTAGWFTKLFVGNTVHKWHTFKGLIVPDSLWQLMFFIVGFYFGTKGVTEFLKFWKSPK